MNPIDTLIEILTYLGEEDIRRYEKFKNVSRYYTDENAEHYLKGRSEEAQEIHKHILRIIKEAQEGGDTP